MRFYVKVCLCIKPVHCRILDRLHPRPSYTKVQLFIIDVESFLQLWYVLHLMFTFLNSVRMTLQALANYMGSALTKDKQIVCIALLYLLCSLSSMSKWSMLPVMPELCSEQLWNMAHLLRVAHMVNSMFTHIGIESTLSDNMKCGTKRIIWNKPFRKMHLGGYWVLPSFFL